MPSREESASGTGKIIQSVATNDATTKHLKGVASATGMGQKAMVKRLPL